MAYNFDEIIDRSGTNCAKWSRAPEGYLPFTIADSDFWVAPAISDAIKRRAEHPLYGYTFPNSILFEVFIDWFSQNYQYTLDKSWLKVLPGIVPALAVVSLVAEGKVITNVPNYGNLLQGPVRAGKEVIHAEMKNTDEYYEIDFDELEAKVTEDTSIFYLCNPHNPVGRVYTREELEQISAFAKKHHLIVVSDEIHCELVFDRPHIPFLSIDDYAKEHSITFTAPGKTYNIPGVSAAFAIIPNEELRTKFEKVSYALGHPGLFNIEATIAAYRDSQDWKTEMVEYLKGNRDYLESELKRRFPKAKATHVEGTYLAWIDFTAYTGEVEPEKWIYDNAKVIVQGSEHFGAKGRVRLNFACPRALIKQALDRIEAALS